MLHIFQIDASYLDLCCSGLQWYSRDSVSSSNGLLFDVVKLGKDDDNKFVFLGFVNEHVNHCERIA